MDTVIIPSIEKTENIVINSDFFKYANDFCDAFVPSENMEISTIFYHYSF